MLYICMEVIRISATNNWETFVPTFPDSPHHPECNLCTGPVLVCRAAVVQLHHTAIVDLDAIGPVAHGPFGAVCHLLK